MCHKKYTIQLVWYYKVRVTVLLIRAIPRKSGYVYSVLETDDYVMSLTEVFANNYDIINNNYNF